MNTDTVKQLCDEALQRLATALEEGHSEALKTYLATMSRFPKYSWGNVLLIFTQKPNASHVAGFQTWRKLKRFVRKGEKGIVIFAPVVKKISTEAEAAQDEQARLCGFRTAYVFDESQTDGEPLPAFASVKGDPMQFTGHAGSFDCQTRHRVGIHRPDCPGKRHVQRRTDRSTSRTPSGGTVFRSRSRTRSRADPQGRAAKEHQPNGSGNRSRGCCLRGLPRDWA